MSGEYTFTLGMNCVENLSPGRVRETLTKLLKDGTLDILYPTIYENAYDGRWYLTTVRSDGNVSPSRCLKTLDGDEALMRAQYLFQPVFDSRLIVEAPSFHASPTPHEPEKAAFLRARCPELARWSDVAVLSAWGFFSIIVYGIAFCEISAFFGDTFRDESFLDYLWHLKILGETALPPVLKRSISDFLAGEVAIWRKWKVRAPCA